MSQPQTESEFIEYVYALIGRQLGEYANDYHSVFLDTYYWNGQYIQIPMNVPGAGEMLPADAPFYGLTQQVGGDGLPKGRLWIPAVVPQVDENGHLWYTQYIQYIKDKPGGVHGIDFLWDWDYLSGNGYVPLAGAD